MRFIPALAALAGSANAYFLMGADFLMHERIDAVVNPGTISNHVHSIAGGSNLRITTSTASLRQSLCTTTPIKEDKSAYWVPTLYFQWGNGSFSSVNGGTVLYYHFTEKAGVTTPFPDDFRMISGDPLLRTFDKDSYAQQAVTFLCLDFSGTSVRTNELPDRPCPNGIRSEINFPNCWDGKNVDSPDHKSHVAFLSGGPDKGTCTDPKFPKTLPRIFMEVYWDTASWDRYRSQAKNPSQPFVFANGDPTGYGYHADFINGWDAGVLQKVVDNCFCNPFGDPKCCADKGLFTLVQGVTCRVTKTWDEQTTGTLPKLPGNNPVQPKGQRATAYPNDSLPPQLEPIAYTGNTPPAPGKVVSPGKVLVAGATNPSPPAVGTSSTAKASTSSPAPPPAGTPVAVKPSSTPPTPPAAGTPAAVKPSSTPPAPPAAGTPAAVKPSTSPPANQPAKASPLPSPSPVDCIPLPEVSPAKKKKKHLHHKRRLSRLSFA